MAEQWARNAYGGADQYPAPSGMVGMVNPSGFWGTWMPAVGIKYEAEYGGVGYIAVTNKGDGTYDLTMGGSTNRHAYDSRWLASLFFDALGSAVADFYAARAAGDPTAIYYQPGRVVGSAQTQPPPLPVLQPPAAQAAVNSGVTAVPTATANPSWTKSSDGRSDVYCSDSGMVGSVNPQFRWVCWMPGTGITYESHYDGGTIKIMSNGDRTYMYQDEQGNVTQRRYASNWIGGTLYDAAGGAIANPDAAAVVGDPRALYYLPGALVTATPKPTGNPVSPAPGGVTPGGVTPGSSNDPGTGNVLPGSLPLDTSLPASDGGPGTKPLMVLAAVAAFALLS